MAEVLHAFELFEGQSPGKIAGSVSLYGTDPFLRSQALTKLLQQTKVADHAIRKRDGDQTTWRDIHDDLATRSLFDEAGPRFTIIRSADSFVTKNRAALERWAESSVVNATLVLELDSFPGNTKLYKLIQKQGTLVQCSVPIKKGSRDTPDDKAIQKWLIQWGKSHHSVTLSVKQANVMVDRIGAVFGLIDTELAKIALLPMLTEVCPMRLCMSLSEAGERKRRGKSPTGSPKEKSPSPWNSSIDCSPAAKMRSD